MDLANPYVVIAAVALVANLASWFVSMTCPMSVCRECPSALQSTDVRFFIPPGSVFSLMWTVLYSLLAFTTVRAFYLWRAGGDSAAVLVLVTGVLMFMVAQHYVFMASPDCFRAQELALYDILFMLALAYMHLLGAYAIEGPLVACAAIPMVVWLTMALQMQYARTPADN